MIFSRWERAHLQHKKNDTQENEPQPSEVYGNGLKGIKGEDQGHAAEDTGEDRSGRVDLEEYAEHPDHHQDVGHVWVTHDGQEPVFEGHSQFDYVRVPCPENHVTVVCLHSLSVNLQEQVLNARR